MPVHWLAWVGWLTRPEDGPVLVVLAAIAACGLLGGLWRRVRAQAGAPAQGRGPV